MQNSRPHLTPGTPVLWRDAEHVQIGLHPLRSLILKAHLAVPLLELCNGQTACGEIIQSMAGKGASAHQVQRALKHLLDNRLMHTLPDTSLRTQSSDLNAISHNDAPRILMQRELANRTQCPTQRNHTAIHLHGLGRLGMTVASALASAGFPHLRAHDSNRVTAQDVTTFGASRVDIGNRRDFVALQIIERVQAGVTLRNNALKFRPTHELHLFLPDAVADYPWFDHELGHDCLSRDIPHLVATTAQSSAIVTSVVQPGVTGCLRCLHLHNSDHDKTWPLINAQLIGRTAPDLSPIGLVVQAALLVVETVSRWVDEGTTNDNEVVCFAWPNHRMGVMVNTPHPECGCSW